MEIEEASSSIVIDNNVATPISAMNAVEVAEASLEKALSILAQYRPTDHSMKGVTESYLGKIDILEDEWRMGNDVYLRIAKMNALVPSPDSKKPEVVSAMATEVWHAFFLDSDISPANKGIRADLARNASATYGESGGTCINHFVQPALETSYVGFKKWIDTLCGGDRTMEINYFAKFHHCRWFNDSAHYAKFNCMNLSQSVGRTSFMLHLIARTCPSGVVGFPSVSISQAFNVETNQNDQLIIVEETPLNLLRNVGGDGNNDALNMFRSKLTTGISTTLRFFLDEMNDNRRDVKCVRQSVQGSYLMATPKQTIKPEELDPHMMSRFVIVDTAFGSSKTDLESRQEVTDVQLAEHRDVHRGYYLIECMEKSGVIKVETEAALVMINDALGRMQEISGVYFQNPRQRNNVLELARIICIASSVWSVMASPDFKELQNHPDDGKYIGLNLRVLVEGIFPRLVINKHHVIYALTLMSVNVLSAEYENK